MLLVWLQKNSFNIFLKSIILVPGSHGAIRYDKAVDNNHCNSASVSLLHECQLSQPHRIEQDGSNVGQPTKCHFWLSQAEADYSVFEYHHAKSCHNASINNEALVIEAVRTE